MKEVDGVRYCVTRIFMIYTGHFSVDCMVKSGRLWWIGCAAGWRKYAHSHL